jgi:hypothetical protein
VSRVRHRASGQIASNLIAEEHTLDCLVLDPWWEKLQGYEKSHGTEKETAEGHPFPLERWALGPGWRMVSGTLRVGPSPSHTAPRRDIAVFSSYARQFC